MDIVIVISCMQNNGKGNYIFGIKIRQSNDKRKQIGSQRDHGIIIIQ